MRADARTAAISASTPAAGRWLICAGGKDRALGVKQLSVCAALQSHGLAEVRSIRGVQCRLGLLGPWVRRSRCRRAWCRLVMASERPAHLFTGAPGRCYGLQPRHSTCSRASGRFAIGLERALGPLAFASGRAEDDASQRTKVCGNADDRHAPHQCRVALRFKCVALHDVDASEGPQAHGLVKRDPHGRFELDDFAMPHALWSRLAVGASESHRVVGDVDRPSEGCGLCKPPIPWWAPWDSNPQPAD